MIQKYMQTTYETCLACCLLQAVDRVRPIKITKKLEMECLIHSLKYSKDDFVSGHLDFIGKFFGVKISRIVDNGFYYNFLKKKPPANTKTVLQRIDSKLIDSLLMKSPIINIDDYYLHKVFHYPHWITVLEKNKSVYKIFDVWDGKIKNIEGKTLTKCISSYRNRLKMCPQALLLMQ